jgi:hypothetical protein
MDHLVSANLIDVNNQVIGLHLQRAGNQVGDNGEISFGTINSGLFTGDLTNVTIIPPGNQPFWVASVVLFTWRHVD